MASMIAKLWTRLCAKRVPLSIMIVGLDNSGKTSILNYLASQNLEAHSQNQLSSSSKNNTLGSSSTPQPPSGASGTMTTAAKPAAYKSSGDNCCSGGNIMPTFGYSYERIQYKNVTITVLDFSGQNRYRNLWQEFYDSVDGLVFVLDSSDLISLSSQQQQSGGQSVQLSYPIASEAVQKQITICQGKLIQSPLNGALSTLCSTTTDKTSSSSTLTASKKLAQTSKRRTRVPILFLANKTDLASSVDTEVIAKALNLNQLPLERHPWFIQATSVKLSQGIVEGFDWLVSQLSVN